MKEQWLHPQVRPFFDYLKRYAADRGALANLRGALSEARRANAWPLLGGFQHGVAIGKSAFEKVAGLWAANNRIDADDGSLGDTCRVLAGKHDEKSGKFEHDSYQARFKRLLTCDKEEIVDRVVPVVKAAQAKGVPVNYPQLLSDLLCWSDKVQVEWALAFWGKSSAEPGQEGAES